MEVMFYGVNLRTGSRFPDEFEDNIATGNCNVEIGLDAKSLVLSVDAILD